MATLTWDHAVQFVNQPEAAIQALSGQKLNAVAGGRHPGWGTRNALSYFGLTYIEFLAIADDTELLSYAETFLLSRDASRLLPDNEALYRVALRSIRRGRLNCSARFSPYSILRRCATAGSSCLVLPRKAAGAGGGRSRVSFPPGRGESTD